MSSFPVYVKRGTDIVNIPFTRLIVFININGMQLNFLEEGNTGSVLDIFLDFKDENDRNLFLLSWSEYFATLPPFNINEEDKDSITTYTMSAIWDDVDEEYEADQYL